MSKSFFYHFYLLFIFIIFSAPSFLLAQTERNPHIVNYAIKEENRSVAAMPGGVAPNLPVGISSTLAGQEYTIGVQELVLTPQGSFMTASTSLDIPLTGDKMGFIGNNITITPGGIKGGGNAALALTSDLSFNLSNQLRLRLFSAQRKSYVFFNCHGYVAMGLQGEFEFCRNFLLPELSDGSTAPEPATVRAEFETKTGDAGNFLAKVSITPFQVPTLKGFGFYVQDAWVDRSDFNNPDGLLFPEGYNNPAISGGSINNWQGFFVRNTNIKLPALFNGSDGKRKELSAYNLVVDDMGVTGNFAAKNLIDFKNGSLSGWPFSVDSLACTLASNRIVGAGFGGNINLPITKEDTKLSYAAMVQEGGIYSFNVRSAASLEVPLWSATMTLYPTTTIGVKVADNKFQASAVLNGNIDVATDLGYGGDKSNFKGLEFQNVVVSTQKPYFSPGTFTLAARNSDLSGFAVTLHDIGVVSMQDQAGLHLGIDVHLMKDSLAGFSGTTSLNIMGKMQTDLETKRQRWVFDKVQLDNVGINIHQGAYSIQGVLAMYKQHPVFGTGFMGAVNASFEPGLQIAAKAQFGKVSDFRYWYVDGLLKFPTGVQIVPGFGLYGFGGGIYHHMRQKNFAGVSLGNASESGSMEVPPAGTEVTKPVSGAAYVPDSNTMLGLKATVLAGTYPTPEAFNADVTFEMAFNPSGGVNDIGLKGNGYFMSTIGKGSTAAPLFAQVNIGYNLSSQILHGTFNTYVNIPGIMKGIYGDNLAGPAAIHYEKSKWYVHAGTPRARLGIDYFGLFKSQSYLMMGTEIEPMPPLDTSISNILGTQISASRNEMQLKTAKGFAFGSSISLTPGKLQFLMFYGYLNGSAGFDFMLQQNPSLQCKGHDQIGINGWYGSGQAYAYMQGVIGLHVDLPFTSGEYKILEIGAATVLQAKLPNPSYFQGEVGGYYALLNGKIRGNCRFGMKIGEQCEVEEGGSVVSGMKVIAELSPKEGEKEVSVFANPQAAFNLPLDKAFEMKDVDGAIKSFRAILKEFKLELDGTALQGTLQWDAAHEVAAFKTPEIFPSEKKIKVTVKVFFEENKSGTWQPVMVKGVQAEEVKEITFTTGVAPDYIDPGNIEYSYPVSNQYNFYKSEYPLGYIKLIKWQNNLFTYDNKWKKTGRFLTDKGTEETGITFSETDKTISFSIPPALENEKIYNFELVNVPQVKAGEVNENVTNIAADSSLTVSMADKRVEGTREVLREKVLYSNHFRTSKYNTFTEKISAWSISKGWSFPILQYTALHYIGVSISGAEMFDKAELSVPLLKIQAQPNNRWYTRKVYPLIYAPYPINGATVSWRDTSVFGLPPLRAVSVSAGIPKELTPGAISSNQGTSTGGYGEIIYDLPYNMNMDYKELRDQCAQMAVSEKIGPEGYKILNTIFPDISSGDYDIKLYYTLPGTGKVTSVKSITIKNP